MSDIKTINISGDAAKDMGANKRSGGRRGTKKNQQQGGSDEAVRGTSQVINLVKGVEPPSVASNAASPNSNTWLTYPKSAPVPPMTPPIPARIPASPLQAAAPTGQYAVPAQAGGSTTAPTTKHIKVELKKKSSAKKVHLNPKKTDAPKAQLTKKHQTRKVRKVSLGVSNLHKRLTRAKKLHKNINDMPIEKLKDKLIKGGLIKANSKAPEAVLRTIAKDAEVVAKKAL
jgi:hypothetical protein